MTRFAAQTSRVEMITLGILYLVTQKQTLVIPSRPLSFSLYPVCHSAKISSNQVDVKRQASTQKVANKFRGLRNFRYFPPAKNETKYSRNNTVWCDRYSFSVSHSLKVINIAMENSRKNHAVRGACPFPPLITGAFMLMRWFLLKS